MTFQLRRNEIPSEVSIHVKSREERVYCELSCQKLAWAAPVEDRRSDNTKPWVALRPSVFFCVYITIFVYINLFVSIKQRVDTQFWRLTWIVPNDIVQGSKVGWQENLYDSNCNNLTFQTVTLLYTLLYLCEKILTFF